ncbi:hypothetical protein ACWEYY_00345 [Staphylococcus xylosus]
MENEDILAQITQLLEYFDTSELNGKQIIMLGKMEDLLERLRWDLEDKK